MAETTDAVAEQPEDERWESIPSCPEFEASDLGRIRGTDRTVAYSDGRHYFYPAKIRKACLDDKGYPRVRLRQADGLNRTRLVHHLILEAFVGPCPDGQEGCHWDGDPTDNRLANLRWDTHSANQLDTSRYGNNPQRRKTHCPRQHPLAKPNLVDNRLRKGYRICLVCTNASIRASTLRSKGIEPNMDELVERAYRMVFDPPPERAECPNGHPKTLENREFVSGKDRCKPCARAAAKRYSDRKRAER